MMQAGSASAAQFRALERIREVAGRDAASDSQEHQQHRLQHGRVAVDDQDLTVRNRRRGASRT